MIPATAAGEDHLGPRARPPWVVRFGIWLVLATVAAILGVSSLISYRDEMRVPVTPLAALPVRAESAGRVHFLRQEGDVVIRDQVIASVQPRVAGSVFCVVTVPASLAAATKPGNAVTVEVEGSHGREQRIGKIDAVVSTGSDSLRVRVVMPGSPAAGTMRIAGRDQSILRRLVVLFRGAAP